MVVSSGIVAKLSSSFALNCSVVPVVMSLRHLGMELKSCAPLTSIEASLAFLTEAGALFHSGLT